VILVGDADAKPGRRLTAALNPKAIVGNCIPAFKGDPYPVADADGNIAFMSLVPHGRDALFVYSHGTLTCLVKAGNRPMRATKSECSASAVRRWATMADRIQRVSNRQQRERRRRSSAVAIARGEENRHHGTGSRRRIRAEPHRIYAAVRIASALSSSLGITIAFTAKTPTGAALFLYSGGSMTRVLTTAR